MPPSSRLRKDKRQSMFLFVSHCDKVCVSTRRLDFCFVLGSFFWNRTETGGSLTWFLFDFLPVRAGMKHHSCWTEYIFSAQQDWRLSFNAPGWLQYLHHNESGLPVYGRMRKAPKQTDNPAYLQGRVFLVLIFLKMALYYRNCQIFSFQDRPEQNCHQSK